MNNTVLLDVLSLAAALTGMVMFDQHPFIAGSIASVALYLAERSGRLSERDKYEEDEGPIEDDGQR